MTIHFRTRSQARPGRTPRRAFQPGVQAFEPRLLLSTFTVTNDRDDFSGGTLREAIYDANASADPTNTIAFDIPGAGPHVIKPFSPLPEITQSVVIDGYTEPGSSPNTAAQGDNAVLGIEIDGSGISNISNRLGLLITADNSTVRGLSIVNFDGYGMVMNGANNRVEGNFVGVLPDGVTSGPNGLGVGILGGGAVVGGATPAARNLISGNAAGLALANLTIGGSAIIPVQPAAGAVVQNNLIGTDATGNGNLGNVFVGIALAGSNNVIGGTGANQPNTIAYNGQVGSALNLGAGLVVVGLKPTSDAPPALVSSGNLISGNAIFSNQKVGIAQLDIPLSSVTQLTNLSSTNAITAITKALTSVETHGSLVQSPILTSAVNSNGVTTVLGTVTGSPNTNYRVQFFSRGGRVILGESVVSINAAGTGAIAFTSPTSLAVGQDILATAIAPDNSTSPFSATILVTNAVTPPPPPPPAPVQVSGTDVSVSKKVVSRFVVHFGAAVTGADNPANYHLALVKMKRVRGHLKTVATPVRVKAVTYDPSTFTATVVPVGKLSLKKVNQLTINGGGILDAFGRPIDGDQNGTPGGDVVVRIGKG